MRIRHHATGWIAAALLALVLGGCATYYPAGPDRGVYYEKPQYRSTRITYVDPLVYPYWSLDYFYYSHYYHPYSVLVHRYDPWYYPYPGWYYGYGPGPRFAAGRGRFHVPWYRYPDRYATYHPWRAGTRVSFGHYSRDRYDRYDRREAPRDRLRDINSRLRDIESRRARTVRNQRPDQRLLPGAAPRLPATGRGAAAFRDGRSMPPLPARRAETGRRSANERTSLLQRLRDIDRRARVPERRERRREPSGELRPRDQESRPPSAPIERTSPSRQRSVDPSPPRNRSQRRPTRESTRPPRNTSRQRRDQSEESDQRDRR